MVLVDRDGNVGLCFHSFYSVWIEALGRITFPHTGMVLYCMYLGLIHIQYSTSCTSLEQGKCSLSDILTVLVSEQGVGSCS